MSDFAKFRLSLYRQRMVLKIRINVKKEIVKIEKAVKKSKWVTDGGGRLLFFMKKYFLSEPVRAREMIKITEKKIGGMFDFIVVR